MPTIELIAAGQIQNGPYHDLYHEYLKRMRWTVTLQEIKEHNTDKTQGKILEKISSEAYVIALDETGKNVDSHSFSENISKLIEDREHKKIQFVIGGADGLNETIRNKAQQVVSFGKLTWPHKLVRVMLIEQLYRAQQIYLGHPYHRD